MKPGGKDGKLYAIEEQETRQGPATLDKSGFYKIKSVAEANSALPTADVTKHPDGKSLSAGQVVHLWKGQSLAAGDSVIPLKLTLVSFVKDVSNSKQGTTYDVSTQENLESGVREFITGAFTESSGTINGTFETDSDAQRALMRNFEMVTVDDGTHITVLPAKQVSQDYMMSRRETEVVGETAVWEHFPVTVESVQTDKPLDGEQNFNFNYKVDGGKHPGVIFYKVIAEPEDEPAQKYTVSFNADGGTGDDPEGAELETGEEFTLPANPYTKEGYEFAGWKVGNCSTVHDAGDKITIGHSNVTIKAVWTESQYGG